MSASKPTVRQPSPGRVPWRLHERDQLLGTLTVVRVRKPWLNAHFRCTPRFARWRSRFDDELALLNGLVAETTTWEETYRQLTRALTLRDPCGRRVPGFLLHIDGDAAWWRRISLV